MHIWLLLFLLGFLSGTSDAAPPTDAAALKLYNHCQDWLKNFPASYVATNIRGDDKQYEVRRQAALDMLRDRRDFSVVYDLMVELDKGNFLSEQIIDLLLEWKSRRAIPILEQIAQDKKRPKALREKAKKAAATLISFQPAAPPKF